MTRSSPEAEPQCPGRCLESLGLHDDPISNPLIYPGRRPQESGLLANECFLSLHDDGTNQVGRWLLDITAWALMEGAWDGAKRVPLDEVVDEGLDRWAVGDVDAARFGGGEHLVAVLDREVRDALDDAGGGFGVGFVREVAGATFGSESPSEAQGTMREDS